MVRVNDHLQCNIRPGRGVQTNLACFIQFISERMDKRTQVGGIYTDFQKAVDKVNHTILQKMAGLGFSREALQLSKSYFSDREQYVGYKGAVSGSFPCPSGVPQWSNLGPLFFAIFINDIGSNMKHSQMLLYADDMKIFYLIKCESDCGLLQADLDSVVQWSDENRLPFNIKTC